MTFARGSHAKGECRRCGFTFPLKQLRADGDSPNLLVCPECWDPEHPQERILPMIDPVALERPAPELSVPDGEGDAAPTLDDIFGWS